MFNEPLEKSKVFKIKNFSLYIIPKFTILALIKNPLSKLIILVLMESVNFHNQQVACSP